MDLWLCGGGEVAGQLLDEIDEFHLKVNPVLLGAGTPILGGRSFPTGLTLVARRRLGDQVDPLRLVRGRH